MKGVLCPGLIWKSVTVRDNVPTYLHIYDIFRFPHSYYLSAREESLTQA